MKFTQVAALLLLFSAAAVAVPTKTLKDRSTTYCGQYDSVVTGSYTVYTDLWGEDNASSGSQCLTIDSESDGTITWSTSWTWAGGSSDVKSYSNVALTLDTGVQISEISSIPTVWKWSYTGDSIVADVSYDMFTAASASGTSEYEIMVWLAALGGAGPISSTGSPIATPTISGIEFKLYSGPNGDTTVYSFVATSEATDFDGDLKLFYTYLIDNEGFSSSQYITTLEAGTEPFTGTDAILSVSAYSVSIEASGSTSSASSASEGSVTPGSSTANSFSQHKATHTSTKLAASVTPTFDLSSITSSSTSPESTPSPSRSPDADQDTCS